MVYNAAMRWTVNLTREAHKQLVKLPQSVQDLADLAVADLEEQGVNPQGWNTLKTDNDGKLINEPNIKNSS